MSRARSTRACPRSSCASSAMNGTKCGSICSTSQIHDGVTTWRKVRRPRRPRRTRRTSRTSRSRHQKTRPTRTRRNQDRGRARRIRRRSMSSARTGAIGRPRPAEDLDRCRKFGCPDCMAHDFVQQLRQRGMLNSGLGDKAELTHWPGQESKWLTTCSRTRESKGSSDGHTRTEGQRQDHRLLRHRHGTRRVSHRLHAAARSPTGQSGRQLRRAARRLIDYAPIVLDNGETPGCDMPAPRR